jgi:hypothetical protein
MTADLWAKSPDHRLVALSALSERRTRLFAAALARSVAQLAPGDAMMNAVDAAEQFADTGKSKAALQRARKALADARVALEGPDGRVRDRAVLGPYMALEVANTACTEKKAGPGGAWYDTVQTWLEGVGLSRYDARYRVYSVFLEVAGPARPDPGQPSWRLDNPVTRAGTMYNFRSWCTDTAVALARQMYESRDFSAMPILADALQDAGCEDEHTLNHCRGASAVHVRGCWVVDLVLGKE